MEKTGNKILSGALFLAIGAFVSKLLGAVYRVPLTNLLGGTGLGLYQMVFPVYTFLLDFSGHGIPSALSRLISSNDKGVSAEKYLKASLKLLIIFGGICSILMFVFARPVSILQGNSGAFLGYVFLSPAIVLVSLISCYRGYFQGAFCMSPTAISQIIEQAVKLLLGLLFVTLLLSNLEWAVAGATFAVTISEACALGYLLFKYKKTSGYFIVKENLKRREFLSVAKKIIKVTIPITLVGVFIPLSQVVDSFLVVNILGKYRADAVALYGLLSGVVATIIGLPVAVCHGVATVAIPVVSKGKSQKEKNDNGAKLLALTLLVAFPCAVFCYLFSPWIINFLFKNLSTQEKGVATELLKISSPCIVFLSFLQTGNGVLIGKGKYYLPVLSLGIGVIVKEILNVILLSMPELNIYGGAISVIACYFIVCLINLIMTFSFKVKDVNKSSFRREYAS